MPKKIVIVDDDYGIQDVAKLIFEKAGYNTIVLATPQQLYEHMHTDASIVILDKQLAGFDGLQVCKDLKESAFAHIPVLVMSATSNVPINLTDSKADGFIEKPFQKQELLKRIEDILL